MFKHLSTKSLEVMLQLFNKIWFTGNSSVLAAFQCSSSGQAKPTLALTGQYALPAVCANSLKKWSYVDSAGLWSTTRSLVSPSPASDSAEKQRSHSPSPWRNSEVPGSKHNVLSVFIDLEKAYDMVSKDVLLSKLLRYGISGRMFRFIHSFLSNRTFK